MEINVDNFKEKFNPIMIDSYQSFRKQIKTSLKDSVLRNFLHHFGFPQAEDIIITSFAYLFIQLHSLINYLLILKQILTLLTSLEKSLNIEFKDFGKSHFTIIERNYEIIE